MVKSSEPTPANPAQVTDAKELADRITDYLTNGGLFNPEMMPHGPACDLLIDCRAALTAAIGAGGQAVAKPEPDFATSIAEVVNEESAGGAACGWKSCTGCHETNEGAETGHYPYSTMFGCYVGSGCSECGGLGVVWEHCSDDALKMMAADVSGSAHPAPSGQAVAVKKDSHNDSNGVE